MFTFKLESIALIEEIWARAESNFIEKKLSKVVMEIDDFYGSFYCLTRKESLRFMEKKTTPGNPSILLKVFSQQVVYVFTQKIVFHILDEVFQGCDVLHFRTLCIFVKKKSIIHKKYLSKYKI